MKKGDLSMSVIIGAAIALLILVIISVLIFKTANNINKGTSCDSVTGSQCIDQGESCSDYGTNLHKDISMGCPNDGICCVPLGDTK